ncbi:hypothetical protein [Geminicoccus flavidas]|nr:hypothetical protein [Geminicoccus flavidas]
MERRIIVGLAIREKVDPVADRAFEGQVGGDLIEMVRDSLHRLQVEPQQ